MPPILLSSDDIENYRSALESQIADLEAKIGPLNSRLSDKKTELDALEKLIRARAGAIENLVVPNDLSSRDGVVGNGDPHRSSAPRWRSGFTPVHVYWPYTLQSLVELGGSASGDEVIQLVGKKMESILTAADKERLESGTDVRWRNRVAWQRFNMVREGLISRDSPRGVWEITETGRKWLTQFVADARQKANEGSGT